MSIPPNDAEVVQELQKIRDFYSNNAALQIKWEAITIKDLLIELGYVETAIAYFGELE